MSASEASNSSKSLLKFFEKEDDRWRKEKQLEDEFKAKMKKREDTMKKIKEAREKLYEQYRAVTMMDEVRIETMIKNMPKNISSRQARYRLRSEKKRLEQEEKLTRRVELQAEKILQMICALNIFSGIYEGNPTAVAFDELSNKDMALETFVEIYNNPDGTFRKYSELHSVMPGETPASIHPIFRVKYDMNLQPIDGEIVLTFRAHTNSDLSKQKNWKLCRQSVHVGDSRFLTYRKWIQEKRVLEIMAPLVDSHNDALSVVKIDEESFYEISVATDAKLFNSKDGIL